MSNIIKKSELKCENSKQVDIWTISPILSKILEYSDFKDLVNFNTVCKRWNQLTNHITHNSIKLFRNYEYIHDYQKSLSAEEKVEFEVNECIVNNSKHAPFIKKIEYSESLKPQKAIEIFETFKFLTNLSLKTLKISQDQFLCMIKPLNMLEKLNLSSITVKQNKYKRLYKEAIKLPPTLTNLSLDHVKLVGSPELFIKTINSHSNLKEFENKSYDQSIFLTPFFKQYPNLKVFNYDNMGLVNSQPLLNVFENNPQLVKLKLRVSFINDALIHLSHYLNNLKELDSYAPSIYSTGFSEKSLKFFQPTKIKKLTLHCECLCSLSLKFIISNCSELEELSLIFANYGKPNYIFSLNLIKSIKLIKLSIFHANLTESSLDSVLLNCPYLEDLEIHFPPKWKNYSEIIGRRCINLRHLKLSYIHIPFGQEGDYSCEDYYSLNFLSNNFQFKNTLTSLTLNGLKFKNLNLVHLQDYSKLKSIKLHFFKLNGKHFDDIDINLSLWPDYKLKKSRYNGFPIGIEIIKS